MTDNDTKYSTLARVKAEEAAQARTASRLLAAWELIIPEHSGLFLTHTRQVQLNLLFTEVFNNRLMSWIEFVDRIASSKFLMKKVADGNIDWAITNCQKILAGNYSSSSPTDDDCAGSTDTPHTITDGKYEYSHGGLLRRILAKAPDQHANDQPNK